MIKALRSAILMAAAISVTACSSVRKDNVVDNYHGTKVADPYRWLEEKDGADTRAFIDKQNAKTRAMLDTPLRGEIRARLQELVNYPRVGTPAIVGSRYIVGKNSGLQAQGVTYVYEKLDEANPRVLFDPNTLSADGTKALAGTYYSEDGSLVAYGIAEGGSDESTFYIRDVATGKDLPDVLPNMRFSGASWKRDNSGFFFSKYPNATERLNQKLYFHKLGGDPANPKLVYERPDSPELSVGGGVTEDGKYLVMYESLGTDPRPGILVRGVDEANDKAVRLLQPGVHTLDLVGNDGKVFYAVSDIGASRRRLVAIDLDKSSDWKTILPEQTGVLESVGMVGDTFVVTYSEDARTRLFLYTKAGAMIKEIVLPTVGTAGVSLKREHTNEMFVSFTSFTYPTTTFRYDFAKGELVQWYQPKVQFEPAAYETKLNFYTSKDGTRVPMFITHKKGLALDGSNPTILYGYGGFTAGMRPYFSTSLVAFLERGGVYASAGLRGGDEYGSSWHEAGKLDKKQNVFDDFHAAAEYLAKEGYTSPARLAIEGGSNGGLLVAATMLQRPELYGAVLCHVPVTDMLRFHKFGTGRFWTTEYGNADNSEAEFKTLYAYSPLHNVKPGTTYPPILVTTGDGDDRVVPAHSLKFVATLEEANPNNTTLLRYETKAGHGAGKPLAKQLDERADTLAFMFQSLGFKADPAPAPTPTAPTTMPAVEVK